MNKARSNRLFFVGMVLNFSKFATDISKFATGTVANFEKFETIPKKLWSIRTGLSRENSTALPLCTLPAPLLHPIVLNMHTQSSKTTVLQT